jgi:hypothetical protein
MKALLTLALVTFRRSLSNCTLTDVASSLGPQKESCPTGCTKPCCPKKADLQDLQALILPPPDRIKCHKARRRASGLFHARVAPILPPSCAAFGVSLLKHARRVQVYPMPS